MNLNIKILDQDFVLHPFGAVYWPEQEILFIADVHFGKISHFRKYGSAVPLNAIEQNFSKLDQLRKDFDPEYIIFLGDLFHSSLNMEWDLFENWLQKIDNQVQLIAGNHDIISPLKYEQLGVSLFSYLQIGKFHLSHHPEEREGFFNFCGHLHPGYKLRGTGKQLLNLRCFYKTTQQLVLPAFGEFTGNYYLEPNKGAEIFAVSGKSIFLIPQTPEKNA